MIGIPHDKYGEEVCAWMRLNPKTPTTSEELQQRCEGKLAAFKVPRKWRFVDSYPMTVTGKVQKYLMRLQHIEEAALLKESQVPMNDT